MSRVFTGLILGAAVKRHSDSVTTAGRWLWPAWLWQQIPICAVCRDSTTVTALSRERYVGASRSSQELCHLLHKHVEDNDLLFGLLPHLAARLVSG